MQLKIFQSILFSSLRPWKQGSFSDKDYSQYLRTTGFASQSNSISEFKSAINSIFPKENFTKDEDFDIYELNTNQERQRVNDPLVLIDLPKAHNPKCRFYFYLITNEVTRLSDLLLQFYTGPASQTEKTYVINNLTPQLKQLIKESTKELQSNSQDADIEFILKVLQFSMMRFLLEVEHLFPEIIKTPLTTDEELYFDLMNDEIPEISIYKVSHLLSDLLNDFIINDEPSKQFFPSRITFQFNGDKLKLLNVISELNREIELLKDGSTTPEQVIEVLTSNDITPDLPKIYFNTETTQIRLVIEKLQIKFGNLSYTLIERTGLFYSKKNTVLKQSNLSRSNPFNTKNEKLITEICNKL